MPQLELASIQTEMAELTPQLRWVPKSRMQAADLKLQQAWRILVQDINGYVTESRTEWRDVPVEPAA